MCPRPPGLNRPSSGGITLDLGSHLRRLFECVGYEPAEPTKVGTPGSYHGTARCGGDSYAFAVEYFGREVMTKFSGDESEDKARTKAAHLRFEEGERLCAETNRRFHTYMLGHRPANERVARVLIRAREKIGNLLGNVDWDRVKNGCTFTSGSSVELPRSRSTPIHKYSSKLESTSSALSSVCEIFSHIPALSGGLADGHGLNIVHGNKLTCVPKNYKTHRMIAGEPSGQMYAQKGLHAEIRRLLCQVGVDLSSQRQNQEWAQFGSATGLVATVDMSMASDTVAYTVVEWMYSLVPDVFDYLDRFRSAVGKFADRTVTYEKFSSMGNATTFEIETSIFWALATACCDVEQADSRFVGVYGDDVVIPNRCVELFFDSLRECGFVPNEKKTFFEDRPHALQKRFRESCGKHYFNGEDVTPVYIKSAPKDLLGFFKLVNNTVRWLKRLEALSDAPDLAKAWAYVKELRSLAPADWMQPRIPDGFGDGAFIGTFDECCPTTIKGRESRWVEGYRVKVLTERFDKAFGRSGAGYPLVWVSKKGRKTLKELDCKKSKRNVVTVSPIGFALASLEKLEQGRDQTMVRNWQDRRYKGWLRNFAVELSRLPLAAEGMCVELPHTRQVVASTLTLPLSVTW